METRLALATATLTGTSLTLDGTAGPDTLGPITCVNGVVHYNDSNNDVITTIPCGSVTSVTLIGHDGDDTLSLDVGLGTFGLPAFKLVRIDGRDGDDLILAPDDISGEIELAGGEDDDFIVGSNVKDKIWGEDVFAFNPGHDEIWARGGEDQSEAGPGNDFVNGGDGADEMFGDVGDDTINGEEGDDEIDG